MLQVVARADEGLLLFRVSKEETRRKAHYLAGA